MQNPRTGNQTSKKSFFKYLPILAAAIFILVTFGLVFNFLILNRNQDISQEMAKMGSVIVAVDNFENLPVRIYSDNGIDSFSSSGVSRDLPEGSYTASLAVDGYGSDSEDFSIREDQITEVILSLSGQISDSNSLGSPLGEAREVLTAIEGDTNKEIFTSSDGSKLVAVDRQDSYQVDLAQAEPKREENLDQTENLEYLVMANDCQLMKVEFSLDSENLRYFKTCNSTGESGFYNFDLTSGEESQLVPTSELNNLVKIAIDPSSDTVVFIKTSGEFGLVQDGQVEILATEAFLFAPSFSPDGKYLVVAQDVAAKNPGAEPTGDMSQDFRMQVKAIEFSQLLANKDVSEFLDVGMTYYVPRAINYDFKYIDWLTGREFKAGDDNRIYSLNSFSASGESGAQPGRYFTAADGQMYRFYDRYLFNSQREAVTDWLQGVYEIEGQGIYFLKNGYLYRLADGQEILALPERVVLAEHLDGELTLVLANGEIRKY